MIVFVYFDGLCDSLPSMNGSKEKWPNEFNLASMLIRSDENRENMVDVSGATTPCDDGHFYEYGQPRQYYQGQIVIREKVV